MAHERALRDVGGTHRPGAAKESMVTTLIPGAPFERHRRHLGIWDAQNGIALGDG
jgi:hypothetical protein